MWYDSLESIGMTEAEFLDDAGPLDIPSELAEKMSAALDALLK